MSCPRCGKRERKQISPGFYECRGERLIEDHPTVPPHMRRPSHWETCGHRYQDGAPVAGAAKCSCGRFAVGECARCEAACCGDHSASFGGVLQCGRCLAKRRAVETEAHRQRVNELTAERDGAAAEVAAIVQDFIASGPPTNGQLWHGYDLSSWYEACLARFGEERPPRRGVPCPEHHESGCVVSVVGRYGVLRRVHYLRCELRGALVSRETNVWDSKAGTPTLRTTTVLTPDGRLATDGSLNLTVGEPLTDPQNLCPNYDRHRYGSHLGTNVHSLETEFFTRNRDEVRAMAAALRAAVQR